MQVNDAIRKGVVFLGEPIPDHFVVNGTAFLVSITVDGYDFRYLISARHVVWPGRIMGFAPEPPDAEIWVRMNQKTGSPRMVPTRVRDWIFHESVKTIDICAYRFSELELNADDSLDIAFIDLQTIALVRPGEDFSKYGIGTGPAGLQSLIGRHVSQLRDVQLGDEIFIPGAFISHIGRKKNIPVIRVGCVAALPEEPVEFFSPAKPAYLIETRSVGGISGSPVFLHLAPERARGDLAALGNLSVPSLLFHPTDIWYSFPYLLLGMVLGHHMSSAYLNDFVPSNLDGRPLADADINSRISVVLPIPELLEFLYLPKLVAERASAIEERRRIVGYRDNG